MKCERRGRDFTRMCCPKSTSSPLVYKDPKFSARTHSGGEGYYEMIMTSEDTYDIFVEYMKDMVVIFALFANSLQEGGYEFQ